jgi:hypothetical protein
VSTQGSLGSFRRRRRGIVVGAMVVVLVVAAAIAALALDSPGNGGSPSGAGDSALAAAREVDERDFPAPSGATTLRHLAFTIVAGPKIVFRDRARVRSGARLSFALRRGARRRPVVGPTVVYVAANRDSHAIGPYPAPLESLATSWGTPRAASASEPMPVYEARLPRLAPGRYTIIAATRSKSDLLGDWTEIVVGSP